MDILNLIKNYIIVTWQRLKSESPRYWRRFTWITAVLTATSLFLAENDAIIPEKYKFIAKYVAVAAATATFISKIPTADPVLAQKSDDFFT